MGNILPILISYKMYKEHFKENIQYKRENIKQNMNKNNLKEKKFNKKIKIKKNI